jgi:4-amino-4-deoxy-L-arabinose transferase-like glycosyltransferase
MTARAARVRGNLPLLALVAAGVALRAFLMVEYRPAVLSNPDSGRFFHFAHYPGGLFDDHFGPSGYIAFLKVTRALWDRLEATIALQHLFGIAAALLLYAAVRRLGAPRWAALVPAAVGLLWGDLVYLEHAPLSESPFVVLVAAAMYAAVRGLDQTGRWQAWLVLAGALVATAALFRNVGLVLPPVLAVWALASVPGPVRDKLVGAGAVAAASAVVIGAYAGLAALDGGTTGMSDVSGWNLYGRSAPFADCSRFTPPPGTRFLCQSTPPSRRPGSLFYRWFKGSPARARYGHPPIGDATLGRFGRTAILHQPLDYLRDVVSQLPRFVDPGAYHHRFSGGGPFLINRRNPAAERLVAYQVHRDYHASKLHVGGGVDRIGEWQDTERLGGVVPTAFVVLALLGALLARGIARRGLLLFAGAGAGLVVLPAATLTLISRYTVPAIPLAAAAAGVGAWAVVERVRARRRPAAESPTEPAA